MVTQQNQTSATPVPLKVRLTLAHAYFQHLADRRGVDLIHVKGYAFGTDVYRDGRISTDIDVLVRPNHTATLTAALQDEGWQILTHFETGSIFEHAMTVYHPTWGLADIHRFFPGLGIDAERTFQLIWEDKRHKNLGGYTCQVPSLIDSRIIVLTHAARSEQLYPADVKYLQEHLTEQDWDNLDLRVNILGCRTAYQVALNRFDNINQNSKEFLIWKSFKAGAPTALQWKARLFQAEGIGAKIRVIQKILWVNKDHLAMELGHTPSKREIFAKFFNRFKILIRKR